MNNLLGVLLVLALAGAGAWFYLVGDKPPLPPGTPEPLTFRECAIYYPVQESYPRRCVNGLGVTLTEDVGNAMVLRNSIVLRSPAPNTTIRSPLILKGEAVGAWFNETFEVKVRLLDANNKIIAEGHLASKRVVVAEGMYQFEGALTFTRPTFGTLGRIIIDNPTNKEDLSVPVFFE